MTPILNSKEHQRKTQAQYSMNKQASSHQPVHIVVSKSNECIRVKIWTEGQFYEFEYSEHSKKFKGPDIKAFEEWFERNADIIIEMWYNICNDNLQQYETELD